MPTDNNWIAEINIYPQIWRKTLAAFGWPPDRIEWFVSQYSDELKDESSLFYHEDPAHYLALELLSESANAEISKRLAGESDGWPWELYHPVHEMINGSLKWNERISSGDLPELPDWPDLKVKIASFLAQHDEGLRYKGDAE